MFIETHPTWLLPRNPAHDEIHIPAAALGADEPPAPIEDRCIGPVPLNELSGVRLEVALAAVAPDDQVQLAFLCIAVILGRGSDFIAARTEWTGWAR